MPTRPRLPASPLVDAIDLALVPLHAFGDAPDVSVARARRLRTRVRRDHGDPRWIARTLAALPASARAILGVLVGTTGVLELEALFARVEQTYGFTRARAELALGVLLEAWLVMDAEPVGTEPATARYIALTAPAAGLIALHLGAVAHARDVCVDHVGAPGDLEHAFAMVARVAEWAASHALAVGLVERTRLAAGIGLVPEPTRTEVLRATTLDDLEARLRRTLALPPTRARGHLRLVN